jgi:hypothetical protein
MLRRDEASFDLACRLRGNGAPIGEVFSFLSGLYFRGKLAYARRFARTSGRRPGIYVITAGRGLLDVDTVIGLADLQAFSEVPIRLDEPRYRNALARSVRALAEDMPSGCRVVLLGSIATGKYVEILASEFRSQLVFPTDFVGRGDMSRGGLLLRRVRDDHELEYVPVLGATRHGRRPPKLPPV